MRIRIVLLAVVAAVLLLTTGQAYARCYSPCVRGMNCTMQCIEIPDIAVTD